MSSSVPLAPSIASIARTTARAVLGVLVRDGADFAAAEDAVQEALLAATTTWPRDGVPDSPRAWLITAARRRLIDHRRAEQARRRREDAVDVDNDHIGDVVGDDSLALLALCCHPALSPSSAVALTLRAVCGLSTAEIARAFFVPETTMGQRISRAKQTIANAGGRFAVDDDVSSERVLRERLPIVRDVLHLMFNEGYVGSADRFVRDDLATEAIRLARLLHSAVDDDTEVAGLRALLVLTHARRASRVDDDGRLVPLDEQDRTRWDRELVAEGVALVEQTLPRATATSTIGPYILQAAIAAAHDEAAHVDDTDWRDIAGLYGVLFALTGNPHVALNQVVAEAMVDGADVGLARLAVLATDPRLRGHYRVAAVRGHLQMRAGDRTGAAMSFQQAATSTTSTAERDYLLALAIRCSRSAGSG